MKKMSHTVIACQARESHVWSQLQSISLFSFSTEKHRLYCTETYCLATWVTRRINFAEPYLGLPAWLSVRCTAGVDCREGFQNLVLLPVRRLRFPSPDRKSCEFRVFLSWGLWLHMSTDLRDLSALCCSGSVWLRRHHTSLEKCNLLVDLYSSDSASY